VFLLITHYTDVPLNRYLTYHHPQIYYILIYFMYVANYHDELFKT